jgi:hypothetical protein
VDVAPHAVHDPEPVRFAIDRSGKIGLKLEVAEASAETRQHAEYATYHCAIQGSGEGTALALWDFSENPHRKDGLGHEQILAFTVPVTGRITGTVAVSARLARPGIAGGLEAIRDLVLGPRRSERHHPVAFDIAPAADHTPAGAPSPDVPRVRAAPAPRPRANKHTILFLAANPLGTDRLALDREARAIREELKRSGHGDRFELETWWAAEPLDLLRALRELEPTVVHFSGHGGRHAPGEDHPQRTASHRDIVSQPGAHDSRPGQGLFFQGPEGRARFVSAAALTQTFGAAGSSVKLVVLNACYSDVQAQALVAHVDCVVGMGGSIHDDAARHFAVGFYGGLAARHSVAAAYEQGRAAISLEGLLDGDRPQLKTRDGVDASQVILTTDPS